MAKRVWQFGLTVAAINHCIAAHLVMQPPDLPGDPLRAMVSLAFACLWVGLCIYFTCKRNALKRRSDELQREIDSLTRNLS